MNLTRQGWQAGWRPSDDSVNGNPDGLLRMDNLCYDENGIVSICKGYSNINASAFGDEIHTVYSKKINDQKHRFVGLTDATVRVATGDTFSTIVSGGSIGKAAFTSGLGFVYIFSGNARKKYDGTNVYDITPTTPSTYPGVVEAIKNDFFFLETDFGIMSSIEGSPIVDNGTYASFTTVDNKATVQVTPLGPWNSMVMDAGAEGTPYDQFWLVFRASNTQLLTSVRVIMNLGTSYDPPTDYFWYQWDNKEGGQFNAGSDTWTVLKCQRQDFQKVSTTNTGNWDNVTSLRVIVESTGEFTASIGENGIFFCGSNENPLNGLYEYIQVDVHNSGSAIFKSVASPASPYVNLIGGAAQITPVVPVDAQVNEIWFYRRDVTYLDDVRVLNEPRKLDKWYRVKVIETADFGTAFKDTVSDEEALIINEVYPIAPLSVTTYTDDEIIAVTEPFNGRLFLMGRRDIYITYPDEFGLYSPLWTLRLSGDKTEANLWIKKVSNNQILVGTTLDVYEISGTCEELPEGILDLRITPIGVEYPPIYWCVACDHNIVYYLAADGIRAITGSQSQLISPQLDLLFQNSYRHGVFPIYKDAPILNATGEFSLEVSQGKLWFTAKLTDGNKKTFVYDIKKQLWFLWDVAPNYLYAEEDDTLLGAFTDYVRKMWDTNLLDNVGQDVRLLTVFDANGQPRNRKDVFTLKITADSGNSAVNIQMAKDGGGLINLGNYAFNGLSEQLIEIATTVGLGFRYQLQITGNDLATFKLYNFTIEYEPRPEQLNYLRLQGNNLGTISRKRFITYAFVIDTLGNNITFTPLIDNVADTTSVANTPAKTTYLHYFTDETVGTDIGGILSGGTFEFYQLNPEETISEKLPAPTKYLLIPANDYGNPNRKRHSSYKFSINTRGAQVRFTPRIDGVAYTTLDFSTTEKRTVEYYFPSDTIGIDIGGTLESLADTAFEFYGVITPQELEVFPPKLEYFRIPETNYGIPAKKRIRTMPMELNTNGNDVTFTPIVDGVSGTPTTFNTAHRQTVLHYFTDDQFGIDYSGQLEGTDWFEFYGLAKPVDVEVLPVGKKFDQVGPMDLDRLGKLMGFRIKVYATGTSLPFKIYMNDVEAWSGTITTVPNQLRIYEVMRIPKTVSGTSLRIELGPTDVFHRYWAKGRINMSGMNTDSQEIPFP